jgi:hypothetical protein
MNTKHTTLAAILAGAVSASVSAQPLQTFDIPMLDYPSFSPLDNPANFILEIDDFPVGGRVVGVSWDVTIEAFAPSWLREARFAVGIPQGIGLPVQDYFGIGPGTVEDDTISGIKNYNSNDLDALGFTTNGVLDVEGPGLDFVADQGIVIVEFYEENDDTIPVPDAIWRSGTITLHYIPAEQPCPGDATGEGTVGTADLLILLANWGQATTNGNADGDFDDSGTVGTADLLILLANWGSTCA